MRHHEVDTSSFASHNGTVWGLGVLCYGIATVCGIIGLAFSLGVDSPSYLAGYILLGCIVPCVFCGLKFHGRL